MRQCNCKNHRIFTLRCFNKGLVPVRVRLNSNSIGARKIIKRAERQPLQQRVKDINRLLQDNREGIASSKSRLFSLVTNPNMQQHWTEFIDEVGEVRFNKVKERQMGNFISLFNKSKYRDNRSVNISENGNDSIRSNSNQAQVNYNSSNNSGNVIQGNNNGSSTSTVSQGQNNGNSSSSKWIVNLSSHPLTPAQVSLLSKDHILPLPLITLPMWSLFPWSSQHAKSFQTRMCRNLGLKLTSY